MKKILLLLYLFVSVTLYSDAKFVSIARAQTIAENFYRYKASVKAIEMQLAFVGTLEADTTYYVFNANQGDGFVIVAAEDASLPILGYSVNGHYDPHVILPPACVDWMNKYSKQIACIRTNKLSATASIEQAWQNYETNKTIIPKRGNGMPQLLTTSWDQSTYYNAWCPYDSWYGEKTLTGCVATAMGQIMKYWSYPAQGNGSHQYTDPTYGTQYANFGVSSYNWCAMPDYLTTSNDNVAQLLYYIGVSVEMQYGVSESSSYMISSSYASAFSAYTQYFKYDPTTISAKRRDDYTDYDWIALLEGDLDQRHPIQYDGQGSEGHSWVCDGYDADDYFHMNWGWGGNANSYYSLNNLNPTSAAYFYYDEDAIIGIQPLCTPQIASIDVAGGYSSPCAGEPVSFSASVVNGGSAPVYQWQVNGMSVGSNIPTYSSSSLSNGDIISCTMVSNASCVSCSPATDEISINWIQPIVIPKVVAQATPSGGSCKGIAVTFAATPTNGGTSPTYQWKVNGTSTSTAKSFSSSTISDGDIVVCEMTSGETCPSSKTVLSDTLWMTVHALPLVDAGANSILHGTPIPLGGTPTASGDAPFTYTWSPSAGLNLTNAANPLASPSVTTTYTLSVTDKFGCKNSDAVIVSNPLGIVGIESSRSFELYPNPTTGRFEIQLSKNSGIVSVQIFNTIGQNVFVTTGIGYEKPIPLSLEELPPGMYFIRIDTNEGIQTKKIILEK